MWEQLEKEKKAGGWNTAGLAQSAEKPQWTDNRPGKGRGQRQGSKRQQPPGRGKPSLTFMWNLKKDQTHRNRVEWGLPGTGWWGVGDIGQKRQTPSYEINQFWGSNVQHGDYSS